MPVEVGLLVAELVAVELGVYDSVDERLFVKVDEPDALNVEVTVVDGVVTPQFANRPSPYAVKSVLATSAAPW